ncbi:hypothetical protein TrispH2_000589 [Trichoplax sp. H2]|nr:hypothetical protein TrispH2_000589 [Trichoplax sp. H2]|eukprot:RDD47765.1 hypothetical protein TrispH2_000589 [Trichoplax sp. H2]
MISQYLSFVAIILTHFINFSLSASTTTKCKTITQEDISQSVIWKVQHSPYCLRSIGPTTVRANATLTIEAGVVVRCQTSHLEINGKLIAKGTSSQNIYFIQESNDYDTLSFYGAAWLKTLQTNTSCQDNASILRYCNITGGHLAISAMESIVQLQNVYIKVSDVGVEATRSWIEMDNCTIIGSQGSAITAYDGLYLGHDTHIFLKDCNAISLTNNIIMDTGGVAIEIYRSPTAIQEFINISKNQIIRNQQIFKVIGSGRKLSISHNLVRDNHCSDDAAMQIEFVGNITINHNEIINNKANLIGALNIKSVRVPNTHITLTNNFISTNVGSYAIIVIDQGTHHQLTQNSIVDNHVESWSTAEKTACAIFISAKNGIDARNNTFSNDRADCEINISDVLNGYLDTRYCYWGSTDVHYISQRILYNVQSPAVYSYFLSQPNGKIYPSDPLVHFGAILGSETWTSYKSSNKNNVHTILNQTTLVLLPGSQIIIDKEQIFQITSNVGIYAKGTIENPITWIIKEKGKIIINQDIPLSNDEWNNHYPSQDGLINQSNFQYVNFNTVHYDGGIIIQSGNPSFYHCIFNQASTNMLQYYLGQIRIKWCHFRYSRHLVNTSCISAQHLVGNNTIFATTLSGYGNNGIILNTKKLWNQTLIKPYKLSISQCYFTLLKVAIAIQDCILVGNNINIQNNTFNSIETLYFQYMQSYSQLKILTIQQNQFINHFYGRHSLLDVLCSPNNTIIINVLKNNFTYNHCQHNLIKFECSQHVDNYSNDNLKAYNHQVNIQENIFYKNSIYKTDLISLLVDDNSQFKSNNITETNNVQDGKYCIVKNLVNSPSYQWNYFNNPNVAFQLCNLAPFSYDKVVDSRYCFWGVDDYFNVTEVINDARWNSQFSYVDYTVFRNRWNQIVTTNFTLHKDSLASNTTWSRKDNPHLIYLSLTIPSDVTLTIESGVIIYMDAASQIQVFGSIIAKGNLSHQIQFTSIDKYHNYPQSTRWNRITFYHNNRSSLLKYCLFRFGGLWDAMVNVASPYTQFFNNVFMIDFGQLFFPKNITNLICHNCTFIKGINQYGDGKYVAVSPHSDQNFPNDYIISIDTHHLYHKNQIIAIIPHSAMEIANITDASRTGHLWIYPIKQALTNIHVITHPVLSNRIIMLEIEIRNSDSHDQLLRIGVPLFLTKSFNTHITSTTVAPIILKNQSCKPPTPSAMATFNSKIWRTTSQRTVASRSTFSEYKLLSSSTTFSSFTSGYDISHTSSNIRTILTTITLANDGDTNKKSSDNMHMERSTWFDSKHITSTMSVVETIPTSTISTIIPGRNVSVPDQSNSTEQPSNSNAVTAVVVPVVILVVLGIAISIAITRKRLARFLTFSWNSNSDTLENPIIDAEMTVYSKMENEKCYDIY